MISDQPRKRQVRPIPEILKASHWEVRESENPDEAYVDLRKKQMVVPFDDSEKSEMLRAHELMHTQISPFKDEIVINADVKDRTLQAAEDCRIWQELNRVGIGANQVDVADRERGKIPHMLMEMNSRGATDEEIALELSSLYLARHGTGSEQWMKEELEMLGLDHCVTVADDAYEKFYKNHRKTALPFENVIEAAEYLHEVFSGYEKEKEEEPGEGEPGDGSGEGTETKVIKVTSGDSNGEPGPMYLPEDAEFEFEAGEEEEKEEKKATAPEPKEEKEKKTVKLDIAPVRPKNDPVKKLSEYTQTERTAQNDAGIFGNPSRTGVSGEMEIIRPRLLRPYRPKRGRKKVSTDVGVNPKHLYRATIDQKVFSEKAIRDKGVAILVDCSGSMGMQNEHVQSVLEECAAATIACYASLPNTTISGRLKIVVERKMCLAVDSTEDRDPYFSVYEDSPEIWEKSLLAGLGGGNVVDLPALRWLANRREEIKIWVADGHVTGKRECRPNPKEFREMARLVLDNNIRRANNVDYLIQNRARLMR